MGWFTQLRKGISTETKNKKEGKEGLWYKCPKCKNIVTTKDHVENCFVCPKCDYHDRINSPKFLNVLYGKNYKELFTNITSADPLKFKDTKKYTDRIKASQKKTGLKDAVVTVVGSVGENKLVSAVMDFSFIGGSMGAVVGEKISRSVDYCIKNKIPLMIASQSGGARMMEAAYSLMQMAKVSAKLTQLADAGLPYISMMLDPTTGGVTASYAMLGDINIAEPGALIGFAGPRVIRETIGKDLPKGFQTSEFLLEHGFLDYIVHRRKLRETIDQQLRLFGG